MSVSVTLCFALILLVQGSVGGDVKASKSTQTETKAAMVDWASLEVVDYLRSGAIVVAFVAALAGDGWGTSPRPRVWLNCEVVIFAIGGLSYYFFPATIASYMIKGPLTVMHTLSLQLVGASQVGLAYCTACLQSTLESDSLAYTGWLVSRTVLSLSVLLLSINAHLTLPVFTDQHLTFGILVQSLWFLGCVLQLCYLHRTSQTATPPRTATAPAGGVTCWLTAQTLLLAVCAILMIACPKVAFAVTKYPEPDGLAAMLTQIRGVFVLGGCVLQEVAGLWLDDNAKRTMLRSKLVVMGLALPAMALYQWKHQFLTPTGVYTSSAFGLLYTGMCLVGSGILVKPKRA